jgi:hypothetical protein
MSWLFSVVLLSAGSLYLAAASLHKDWHNYGNKKVRAAIPAVLVLLRILGFVSQYRDRQDKQRASERAAQDMGALKGQVKAANDAQTQNTALFLTALDELSSKVNDLQTEVKTEALQKELAGVKAELESTQKALTPAKAALTFTFVPFTNPPLGQPFTPATEATLPVKTDGSVHVEFSVLNLTDAAAVDGELELQICDQCTFAKEPAGFTRLEGEPSTRRFMTFNRILPAVAFRTLAADVIAPSSIQDFPIAINYRCRTCVLNREGLSGTVRLVRGR